MFNKADPTKNIPQNAKNEQLPKFLEFQKHKEMFLKQKEFLAAEFERRNLTFQLGQKMPSIFSYTGQDTKGFFGPKSDFAISTQQQETSSSEIEEKEEMLSDLHELREWYDQLESQEKASREKANSGLELEEAENVETQQLADGIKELDLQSTETNQKTTVVDTAESKSESMEIESQEIVDTAESKSESMEIESQESKDDEEEVEGKGDEDEEEQTTEQQQTTDDFEGDWITADSTDDKASNVEDMEECKAQSGDEKKENPWFHEWHPDMDCVDNPEFSRDPNLRMDFREEFEEQNFGDIIPPSSFSDEPNSNFKPPSWKQFTDGFGKGDDLDCSLCGVDLSRVPKDNLIFFPKQKKKRTKKSPKRVSKKLKRQEREEFPIGATVQLHGLRSAHLNGLKGKIIKGKNHKGRYGIDVPAIRKQVSIKTENIQHFLKQTLSTSKKEQDPYLLFPGTAAEEQACDDLEENIQENLQRFEVLESLIAFSFKNEDMDEDKRNKIQQSFEVVNTEIASAYMKLCSQSVVRAQCVKEQHAFLTVFFDQYCEKFEIRVIDDIARNRPPQRPVYTWSVSDVAKFLVYIYVPMPMVKAAIEANISGENVMEFSEEFMNNILKDHADRFSHELMSMVRKFGYKRKT